MTGSRDYTVDMPAGGSMHLISSEEVDLFDHSKDKYIEDYALDKANDLMLLGAILTQQIIMFRAQQRMAGQIAELDDDGKPTGEYKFEEVTSADLSRAQVIVTDCAKEIRELEKALGVDKRTREAGGQHTVGNYVTSLKRAGHSYGVRIVERVKEYEAVMMECRWKLRLLRNGDAEDKAYEDLSPEKFCEWLERALAEIEERDKEWAKDKGKLFAGRL